MRDAVVSESNCAMCGCHCPDINQNSRCGNREHELYTWAEVEI